MSTTFSPVAADLFLFCNERDFIIPFSDDTQADVIYTLNSTFRYQDDLLNNDMVNQIYPPELQLNKANVLNTRGK